MHFKEHGKPLSLLHKDYCLLEKDYSQGGQTSLRYHLTQPSMHPMTGLFQNLESKVEANLSPISFDITCHERIRTILDVYDSETNMQASPLLLFAPPFTKTDIERKHQFYNVSIYLHDQRFT